MSCFGGRRGRIDEALHGRQRSDLATRPATLPLPEAARGSDAEPAVTARLPNDALVVVDVRYSANRSHTRLQHLRRGVHLNSAYTD